MGLFNIMLCIVGSFNSKSVKMSTLKVHVIKYHYILIVYMLTPQCFSR